MCGIYGAFDPSHVLPGSMQSWAGRAQQALRHRGPDGEGCERLLDDHALLGHTRLAIIDLATGQQPLTNEDSSISLVCNGEIYNYVELREQLLARGHQFRTNGDCEVLVHLYEEMGMAMLDQIEGMFAFALLDHKQRRLFLARDRFGEKPLYYATLAGSGLAFASEMKALKSLPALDGSLDVSAISQFLALRYVPAPRTHLVGVRKLRAGEFLSADVKDGIRCQRYWIPELPSSTQPLPREEAIARIRQRILETVRIRLRSDVPVAAFLSGGVDSTLVVCAIRELLPSHRFSTFCASFEDEELDEAPFARVIARHVGSDHHEVHFSSERMLDSFDALIDQYDEPFADASMFPTFAVSQAARAHAKVMLSGDGGDECFMGYRDFFRYFALNSLRRAPGVNSAAATLRRHWPDRLRGTGPLDFLSRSDWQLLYPQARYAAVLNSFFPDARPAADAGLDELQSLAQRHARLPYPSSKIESTISSYLPEQILVKVDRASMRTALECRAPFLDTQLWQLASSLPLADQFERGMGKALLRRALPAWVPDDIRWRQKRGFTPPLATWLRGPLRTRMEEALFDFPASLKPLLDPSPEKLLFQRHLSGEDHSDELFRWLVLSRRCREVQGE